MTALTRRGASLRFAARRAFSTAASSLAGGEPAREPAVAAALQLSRTAPLLVQLKERSWCAAAELPGAAVREGSAVPSAARVAVIREAFSAFDAPATPLAQSLASLSEGVAAVSSRLARPEGRLLADEYVYDTESDSYRLEKVGSDLLRLLKREKIRPALVPDVAAALEPGAERRLGAVLSGLSGVDQSTNTVLMVAPTAFAFNPQAAQDNSFMHSKVEGAGPSSTGKTSGDPASAPPLGAASRVTDTVLREYAGLFREISDVAGVKVSLMAYDVSHGTPDAVFPNNWFSTHAAGEGSALGSPGVPEPTLVYYPMRHPNRAAERRPDIKAVLEGLGGRAKVVDMSPLERAESCPALGSPASGTPLDSPLILEGTGVIVPDRVAGIAYVALSERADEAAAEAWVRQVGYDRAVFFRSFDARGSPVYHTNVMMAVGTGVAVVCLDSVRDPEEREALRASLAERHEVVPITVEQMDSLCGNALELQDDRGLPVLALSTRARDAFDAGQLAAIERHVAGLVHAPIDTLEHIGGGGVRCCIAELFGRPSASA